MKIVIVGGGIAGIAFGIIMKNKGHQIVINERFNEIPLGGNAFMMHEDGLTILKNILGEDCIIPGSEIDTFILKRPDETELNNTKMEHWQCIKRKDLVNTLLMYVDKSAIKYNRSFSHFLYDNTKVIAAVFENGEIEYGDMFVGADGCNSEVRQQLFGETIFSKVEVQEILGIVHDRELVSQLKGVFTKYQHPEKGISFGCIPFSDTELIWFNQFDVTLADTATATRDDLYLFTKEILAGFPPLVHTILDATDFSGSYLWNTKDFEPLSSFHSNNVVIIGDAAHVALPFTSAGTTNALCDAEELANQIENHIDLETAFTQFYLNRIDSLKEHLALGRKLKQQFLMPPRNAENVEIPLIKKSIRKENKQTDVHKLEITYFTDPICSTCWAIQPQLKKLKTTYSNLDIKYVMGGLLPSWDNFDRGGISKPTDVMAHWEEEAIQSGMPINNTVWVKDPILSSYPPSIAFKAAQIQDIDKAIHFLRKMNELLFLEGANITNTEIIREAALDSGLDANKLMLDYNTIAPELFLEDLDYTKKLNINILPTFIFTIEGVIKDISEGYQTYENFENKILKHYPNIVKNTTLFSHEDLFKLHPVLTKAELTALTINHELSATLIINKLLDKGFIKENKADANVTYYSIAV